MEKGYDFYHLKNIEFEVGKRLASATQGIEGQPFLRTDCAEIRTEREKGYIKATNKKILHEVSTRDHLKQSKLEKLLQGVEQIQTFKEVYLENKDEYIGPRELFKKDNHISYMDGFREGFDIIPHFKPSMRSKEYYKKGYKDAINIIMKAFGIEVNAEELVKTPDAYKCFLVGIYHGVNELTHFSEDRATIILGYDNIINSPHDKNMFIIGLKKGFEIKKSKINELASISKFN